MSFSNTYTLQLDIKKNIVNVIPAFVAYDTAILYIKVTDSGQPYDLSTADKYTVSFERPDKVIVTGNGTFENGMLKYIFGTAEMQIEGSVEVIAQFYSGTTRISTKPFTIKIIGDLAEGISSTDALPLSQQLQVDASYATSQGDYAKAQGQALGYKGVYDATVAYNVNNIVSYNSILYICNSNTTAGIAPTDSTHWTQMSPMARINSQTWSATDGQTVFTLSNGNYITNSNNIHINVGGVEQTPSAFTETSSTSFTLSEAVSLNTSVYAWWFEGAVSIYQTHHATHEKGGQDELDATKLKNFYNVSLFPTQFSFPFDNMTIGKFNIPAFNITLGTVTLG